jgi:hypothetical protein
MAEHGEIPAAWAGLAAAGTFIGGVIAALLKFWKQPEKPESPMEILTHRVSEVERRQHEMDARVTDVFELLAEVQRTMATCQADIREALTRLQERRK